MTLKINQLLLLILFIILSGCDPVTENNKQVIEQDRQFEAIKITHSLGTSVINSIPKKVIALDMNEVDTLAQLHIPIAGMPKDFVPHFLAKFEKDSEIQDLGAIVQPNIERVYALKPDLILISSLQANHYQALSKLAPTLYSEVNYMQSSDNQIKNIEEHILSVGKIFNKQVRANQVIDKLEAKIQSTRTKIENRSETAMIILHNNGALRFFGPQSRYGFIYSALGMKSASPSVEAGSHGQPISHEFIYKYDPDIIYVIDRTSVMEGKSTISYQDLDNPLLRKTKAWKNKHIHVVDPEAWYVTGASYSALMIMMTDILVGYDAV